MALRQNHKIAIGLVAAFAVVALFAAGWLALDWLDPFNDRRFNASTWVQQKSAEARAAMARDLIRNHLPPGTPRSQVKSLLGAPGEILSGRDAGGNTLPGVETYSYDIGSWSMYSFDDVFVYVHLDGSGKVVGAEINGY